MVSILGDVIRGGMAEGIIRKGGLSPDTLAEYFLGLLRTHSHHVRVSPESPCHDRQVLELFLRGVGVRSAGAPRSSRSVRQGDPAR